MSFVSAVKTFLTLVWERYIPCRPVYNFPWWNRTGETVSQTMVSAGSILQCTTKESYNIHIYNLFRGNNKNIVTDSWKWRQICCVYPNALCCSFFSSFKEISLKTVLMAEEIYTPPEYNFRLGSILEFGAGLCWTCLEKNTLKGNDVLFIHLLRFPCPFRWWLLPIVLYQDGDFYPKEKRDSCDGDIFRLSWEAYNSLGKFLSSLPFYCCQLVNYHLYNFTDEQSLFCPFPSYIPISDAQLLLKSYLNPDQVKPTYTWKPCFFIR